MLPPDGIISNKSFRDIQRLHGAWGKPLVELDQSYRMAILLLAAMAFMIPLACCEKVLIFTEQPLNLGENQTLRVEDVDPATGSVWMALYNDSSRVQSGILGIGGHINRSGINVTLEGVYAGDKGDLVTLDINRTNVSNRPWKALAGDQVNIHPVGRLDKKGTESWQAQGLPGLPWTEMLLEHGRKLLRSLQDKDVLHIP